MATSADRGDTGDLVDLSAHAILVGTADHVPDSELPDIPAVTTTLEDLEAILRSACGSRGRVHRVPPNAPQGEVVAAVEGAVREATGPVLLVYSGHGILGPANELYLATRSSRSSRQVADAVPYNTVRDLLSEAPGGSVVILDCCYSGRAKAPGGRADGPPPFVVTRPEGSYLLSSASWYDLSYAPEGHRHTLFGGRLISLLTDGDPAGAPWLTLDGLYEAVDRAFHGEPNRPWRQSEGTLGSLRILRNHAYAEPSPHTEPPADVPCPYPGMEPFGAGDARHFFGREEMTRRLLDAVCSRAGDTDHGQQDSDRDDTVPVVLVGPSGVGKTSLLTAGLLAGLERRRMEPGRRDSLPWRPVVVAAPGPHPLRALAEVWARATGRLVEDVHDALSTGRLPEPPPDREPCRLLVVDQFEEVFTRCTDAAERAGFIDVLTSPRTTAEPPRVVLGLRADHYGDCLTYPVLARALDQGLFNVGPMDDDALRVAVEGPAQPAGLTLEPGLTERLLHDLRRGDGGPDHVTALPFLAHALRETWRRRSGATLTLAGYEATGGIWHAVTRTTDLLHDELDRAGQEALRELLFRLVHVTDDGVTVRRRVPVGSLLDGLSAPQRAATRAVRERLAAARLITVDRDHAQIAHEALLRAWPRLRSWIADDRELLLQRQKLTDAAREWQTSGRHTDLLLTGVRLGAAVDVLRKERLRHRRLPPSEEALVHASLAAERREQARLRRRFRIVVALLCAVAITAGVAVWQTAEADRQRNDALEQRRLGTLRTLLAEAENLREKNPRLSLRLGLAAHSIHPSAESRDAVFGTLAETGYAGSGSTGKRAQLDDSSAIAPDGRTQASVRKGVVELWDVSDAARPKRLAATAGCGQIHEKPAFSADSGTLGVACADGAVELWSLADLSHPRRTAALRVQGLRGSPSGIAFSPDGGLLAAAGWGNTDGAPEADRSVALWSLAGGRPRRLAVQRGVYDSRALLFSPDGRTLVSATDLIQFREEPTDQRSLTHTTGVTVWDVSAPARPRRLARLDRVGEAMAFSPDGRLLATAHNENVVLWDIAHPAEPALVADWAAHKDSVSALKFDRSGGRLAVADSSDSITVWDLKDSSKPVQRLILQGHGDTSDDMVFDRQADTLTSVSATEVFRWSLVARGRPAVLAAIGNEGGALSAAAFSPNGKTLITGGYDQNVTLWDVTRPDRPRRVLSVDVGAYVQDLAVSTDGSTLASADRKGRITLWDLSTPGQLRKLSVITHADGREMHVDFSSRGSTLVANGAETLFSDGWMTLWDATDPKHPQELRSSRADPYRAAKFSPDGKVLAVPVGLVTYLFPYLTPSAKPILIDDPLGLSAFSPDGSLMTATSSDGLVLVDVRSPDKPRKVSETTIEDDLTGAPVFHPGGNLLAATADSGDVLLLDVGDLHRVHTAATLSSPTEKLTMLAFSPDGRLAVTAPDDATVQIWDLRKLPALSADPIGAACELAGGGLDEDEWQTHVQGLPYKDSCKGVKTF